MPPQKKSARKAAGSQPDQMRLDETRVAEILDIAAEVFIARGFEGASVNEIARRANASKTTFYSRFPTKEKLFMAVLERRMNLVFGEVSTALSLDAPIESALRDYCSHLLRLALSKHQIALLRVVSMESRRFPQLGKRFYELGPKRGMTYLKHYLQEQIRRGVLIQGDPAIMAEQLSSLLTSGAVRWVVLGLRPGAKERDHNRRVDAAVTAFLRAYSAANS